MKIKKLEWKGTKGRDAESLIGTYSITKPLFLESYQFMLELNNCGDRRDIAVSKSKSYLRKKAQSHFESIIKGCIE